MAVSVAEARRITEERIALTRLSRALRRNLFGLTAHRSIEGPHESFAKTVHPCIPTDTEEN